MAATADPMELAEIRRLAADPAKVQISGTANYDLLGSRLSIDDIRAEIVAWIDSGERVKKVTLKGQHAGHAAFEMKPRISQILFYIKVALFCLGDPDEYLLIISAHPDH